MAWEIVGDTKNWEGKMSTCLIVSAGNTKEQAEATLRRIMSNPSSCEMKAYKQILEYANVRVQEDKAPWYMESNATLGD